MRFVVYGAGAIGGTIAVRLADAGEDVRLIARGAQFEAIRTGGLRLVTPQGEMARRIPVVGHPGEIAFGPDDVVLLTMKTQDTDGALRDLFVASKGMDLAVVCAQNGVENERLAARRFRRVYAMMVFMPAAFDRPGEVVCYCQPRSGILDIGNFPCGVDATAQGVAAALERSGFSSRAVADVMRAKYAKLLMNVVAVVPALCGQAARESPFAQRLRQEALDCYARACISAASEAEERQRTREAGLTVTPSAGRTRPGGSVWQSLARQAGSVETDYINGEIVLLGATCGVDVSCNRAAVFCANRMAHGHLPPGTLSVEELERIAGAMRRGS